ncbi:MAG: hypothetical protein ACOVNY_11760 [Chitinophagaceae bacterium]
MTIFSSNSIIPIIQQHINDKVLYMQIRTSLQCLTATLLLSFLLTSCWQNKQTIEQTSVHAIRFLPGKDLKKEIQPFVEKNI